MPRTIKILFLLCCCGTVCAGSRAEDISEAKGDTLSFFKRFSFHTNASDWLLLTPNVGVELNFTGTPRSHYSLLLTGKWNWNTDHTIAPRYIYNVAGASVEARKYWRTGGLWEGHRFRRFSRYTSTNERRKSGTVARDTTVSLPRWGFAMFRRNVVSGRTFETPRTYRAYYAGIYAGYEKFTYAWGRKGIQGDSYNFGFSGGWSTPLYFLRNGHSIDLDLGLSVGAKMMAYDEFRYEEETGCHVYEETKARHFLPYPVVQDIHVGLVFRFKSIKYKVQGGAERYAIWEDSVYLPRRKRREDKRARNWELRDSTWKAREVIRGIEKHKRDSLREDRLKADSLRKVLGTIEPGDIKQEKRAVRLSDILPDKKSGKAKNKETGERNKLKAEAQARKKKEKEERKKSKAADGRQGKAIGGGDKRRRNETAGKEGRDDE